jgi:hypothetical protein
VFGCEGEVKFEFFYFLGGCHIHNVQFSLYELLFALFCQGGLELKRKDCGTLVGLSIFLGIG